MNMPQNDSLNCCEISSQNCSDFCFKIVVFRLPEIITLIDKNLYKIKIKFSLIFRNFTKAGDNISLCLYLL